MDTQAATKIVKSKKLNLILKIANMLPVEEKDP